MNQLSFFNPGTVPELPAPSRSRGGRFAAKRPLRGDCSGADLRDKGIRRAITHAEDVCGDDWQVKALDFLYLFAREHSRFSGEMVRIESKKYKIPEPPSLRAWGAILVKAANRGWIKQVGFVHVDNPKAHRANAALWQSNLCNRIPESLESAER